MIVLVVYAQNELLYSIPGRYNWVAILFSAKTLRDDCEKETLWGERGIAIKGNAFTVVKEQLSQKSHVHHWQNL